MDLFGVTFEVQWRNKSGVIGCIQDVTNIGLWDPEDESLDWKTFKSYVCQNLGTLDEISVAYVDSEGDEVPIGSEIEFQEALKFAKQQAYKGRQTVLKVDKQESSSPDTEVLDATLPCPAKTTFHRYEKQKHVKPSKSKSSSISVRAVPEERKLKAKKRSSYSDHQLAEQDKLCADKMELMSKLMEELKFTNTENDDSPPQWFKKYMHKMKADIVNEVTARVLIGIQDMENKPSCCCASFDRASTPWITVKNNKKKRLASDEDSSDTALGSDTRDHKLLKKIEKLHKREKKLEKKFDSKLEKLENKTKRMIVKKSQSKARCERVPEKTCFELKKRSGDGLVNTYLMDAILLSEGPKTEVHIRPGEHFIKIWQIMNTGTLPWTDKTEIRQTWGTSGLEPEETIVKCPILEPGEKGQIAVNFRAPEFAGTFESYWHFYHMGDRFGHWIGCAVVVDAKEEQVDKPQDLQHKDVVDENKTRSEHPVDLTMKAKPEQKSTSSTEYTEVQQKKVTGRMKEHKDREYESDSDSDNLSVLSCTVTLSSDFEEDENFVFVPMPACFLCDVPLGTVETVPVNVRTSTDNQAATKHRTVTLTSPHDLKIEIQNNEINSTEETIADDIPADMSHNSVVFAVDEDGHCQIQPAPQVFAVDAAGICIPMPAYGANTGDGGSSSQESGESFHASSSSHSSVHGNICTTSTQAHSEATSSQQQSNCSTGSHSRSPLPVQDQLTNIIHILPEPLVTGAVNVATSALSTAKTVISNLRQRSRETTECNRNTNPSCSTTNSQILLEMGFTNKVMNTFLLERYENDIDTVVDELLKQEQDGTGYSRPV